LGLNTMLENETPLPETSATGARAIGEKLRAARQGRHMSLRELASRAEMSASMLSQVETGKAYPSVRSIYSIAAALDLPVDYFFPDAREAKPTAAGDGPTPERPAGELTASAMRQASANAAGAVETAARPDTSGAAPVVHAAGRPAIELLGGVKWSRLTALAEPGAEFLEVTYAPGATSGANMSHHAGREFGLVLAGELVVELGFESHRLGAGDSIIFDSTTPHRLTNVGPGPMQAVWVVLSQR
jgi:transcriptional regulator with XRE-family HTH domain/mannose-6-phosphate isomerase-like protein (cupin superfamily)